MKPSHDIQLFADRERSEDDVKHECILYIGSKMQGKSSAMRDQIYIRQKTYGKAWAGLPVRYRQFIHDMSGSKAFSEFPTMREAHHAFEKQVKAAEEKEEGKFKALIKGHPMNVVFTKGTDGLPSWKEGGLRFIETELSEIEYMLRVLIKYYRNGLVLLDECSNYVEAKPKTLHKIPLINHRNYGWDVIYAFHRMLDVPNSFGRSNHVSEFRIFKTGEGELTPKDLRSKFSNHHKVLREYNRIRKVKPTNKWVQPYAVVKTDY